MRIQARRLVGGLTLVLGVVVLAALTESVAPAFAEGPWWQLTTSMRPAVVAPGEEATIVVQAADVGDASTSGPITLTDVLPSGVTVLESGGEPEVGFFGFFASRDEIDHSSLCKVLANRVTCTLPEEPPEFPAQRPFEPFEMRISVRVGSEVAEPGPENEAEVSGGGASASTTTQLLRVSRTEAPVFGVEHFALMPEEEGGLLDAQAGSHPFQLTTELGLNQTANPLTPPGQARNLQTNLPPGLVGNTTVMPQCSEFDFQTVISQKDLCPGDTAIGVAIVTFDEPKQPQRGLLTWPLPIFNLVPAKGEPARFGFTVIKSPVILDTSVRSGGNYGVTVSSSNISESVNLISTDITIWGTPEAQAHDAARGWECLAGGAYQLGGEPACPQVTQLKPAPFLTLPTSCALPFSSTVTGESWPAKASPTAEPTSKHLQAQSEYPLQDSFGRVLGITGCNRLSFAPSVEVAPETPDGSTPTGMKVAIHVPQEAGEGSGGLVSSAIRNISVSFPPELMLNAASAGGLEACSEQQIGFTGEKEPSTGMNLFDSEVEACPGASKLGTVEIKVPILANPLVGTVYLAAQDANPFGSLLASYIVAKDPTSGVRVKLAGEVALNEQTGQAIASFDNSPQAPLEEAVVDLHGGQRAPFATPALCGAYTTDASFMPWSEGQSVGSESSFEVSSGLRGSGCANPRPFAPSILAGGANTKAGAFSPLSTTVSREADNQFLQSVQLHFPNGVSGDLTGVKLCSEANANAGTCGSESLIGHSTATVGFGNEPYTVTGGEVFLTESYQGAPFGLSIVTQPIAGPFNLGPPPVVVRAKVEVDPRTAALTATTGTIPHILKGVRLEIRAVNVTIDRPNFSFNPTDCEPLSIQGTVTSLEGASSPVSYPFQVANCALLKFTPKIAVSTAGHGSKFNGTSLHFKISYPEHAMGSQAWFEETKIDLPKQLPARNETLQQACLAHVFETERTHCPKGSKIGTATVHTPILPVPLTGPVYFVSYGGAKFPEAVFVLQGYGITVELHGETFISKAGVTSATFRNTPDVPFENIEVSIPSGRFSEFGVFLPEKDHYNLCGHKLSMPTLFKAQNGLEIHQTTPITVTGCHTAHKKTRKKSSKKKSSKKHTSRKH